MRSVLKDDIEFVDYCDLCNIIVRRDFKDYKENQTHYTFQIKADSKKKTIRHAKNHCLICMKDKGEIKNVCIKCYKKLEIFRLPKK